jgi:hypothetical protein
LELSDSGQYILSGREDFECEVVPALPVDVGDCVESTDLLAELLSQSVVLGAAQKDLPPQLLVILKGEKRLLSLQNHLYACLRVVLYSDQLADVFLSAGRDTSS